MLVQRRSERPRHERAYLPEYARRRRASARSCAGPWLVLWALAMGSLDIALFHNGPLEVAAVAVALWGWATMVCAATIGEDDLTMLYFDQPVRGGWFSSANLTRWAARLDEISTAQGLSALSSFGFHDDLRGETPVWHQPEDGLRTVRALRQELEQHLKDNRKYLAKYSVMPCAALAADLAKMERSLERASRSEARLLPVVAPQRLQPGRNRKAPRAFLRRCFKPV